MHRQAEKKASLVSWCPLLLLLFKSRPRSQGQKASMPDSTFPCAPSPYSANPGLPGQRSAWGEDSKVIPKGGPRPSGSRACCGLWPIPRTDRGPLEPALTLGHGQPPGSLTRASDSRRLSCSTNLGSWRGPLQQAEAMSRMSAGGSCCSCGLSRGSFGHVWPTRLLKDAWATSPLAEACDR